MLWRVANSQLHLMGSAHFLPREAQLLPHEAQILDEADVVAFEANFAQAKMPRLERAGHNCEPASVDR